MMVLRDLLFGGLVLGAILALGVNLVPPRHGNPPTFSDAAVYDAGDFRDTVQKVDAAFRGTWARDNVQPALQADDLTIARRLALGLMGTIPSLEEIRQFESVAAEKRITWWIDHILQDRRYSDYVAERYARAFVGTEDGPFVFFRRRKFVNWLSEQIHQKTPYDRIVREMTFASVVNNS